MAKLVINDPETGERICSLVIPAGATREQIIEVGASILEKHRAKQVVGHGRLDAGNGHEAPAKPSREVFCQMCRQPIPETNLAAHVEAEQQRLIKLELQAEAQRGRR